MPPQKIRGTLTYTHFVKGDWYKFRNDRSELLKVFSLHYFINFILINIFYPNLRTDMFYFRCKNFYNQKKIIKFALAGCVISLAAACGGGSGSGSGSMQSYYEMLQGTWVSATDRRYDGDKCGLDVSGNPGRRWTIKVTGERFVSKYEECLILSGNTGFYWAMENGDGTYIIGQIYLTNQQYPSENLRAIDLISNATIFTAYRVDGSVLYLSDSSRTRTGLTVESRAYNNLLMFIRM